MAVVAIDRGEEAVGIEGVKAFHDFTFADRRSESGITFQHHIVADAGKTYKAAHYDHGNGLAIADVDGDGKLTKDELPGRLAERFSLIDGDGDGTVSKDELTRLLRMFSGGQGQRGPNRSQ